MISQERLILFTRYPYPGRVKTRLIPALGSDGATRLHRRLTLRAVRAANGLRTRRDVNFEIHFEGASQAAMEHWLGDSFRFCQQPEGDLGRRMAWAFERSFSEGSQATVIIGSDCPGLNEDLLAEAFAGLRQHPVVLGPANDGGYYLIGLRRAIPQLFSGMRWGTDTVLQRSLDLLKELGVNAALLRPLDDLDRPEDLAAWRHLVGSEQADLGKISVIIPALNEAERVAATVTAAQQSRPHQIIVVDGGSSDQTVDRARQAGATVLVSKTGRAHQMNAGATSSTGNVLLFIHADTVLFPGYPACVAKHLSKPGVAAGAFGFGIAETFPGKRFLEWTTNLRSRWLQLPYGDQGLFLRRSLFEELGGFAALPILEDYELVRRLRRCGCILTASQRVLTSGRRWQRLGGLRAVLLNQWMIIGYHLGRPIEKLAATYRKV